MSNIQNINQSAGSVGPLGSAQPPAKGTPTGDKALFYAMMALSNELGVLAETETSVARLSDALYKNMVPNATNALEKMQQDLDDYTWLQENFSAFASYFTKGGKQPPLGPGMSQGDVAIMKAFYEKHTTISSARAAVQIKAQEVSQQNTFVQESKILPEGLDNNVKSLAEAETQDSLLIAPFTQLVRSLYMRPL